MLKDILIKQKNQRLVENKILKSKSNKKFLFLLFQFILTSFKNIKEQFQEQTLIGKPMGGLGEDFPALLVHKIKGLPEDFRFENIIDEPEDLNFLGLSDLFIF